MISNDLLSEVLGFGVYQSIRKDEYAYNDIKLNIINTELLYNYVNIYELAHNCKLWALSKGYMMKIENHYSNSIQIQIRKTMANSTYKEPWKKTFKNEPEAIFKACQWILDNKEIK
jgi:hypothetical protein